MTDQFKELVKNNKIEEIHNYLNNDEITTLDEYDLKVLFMSFLSITITFNSCEIFKILISKCNDLLIPLSVIQNIAEKGNYCKLLYDTLYEMESRKDSIIENRANNEYEISISNKTTKLCRFSYLSEIKMTDQLEIQKIIIDKIITTNIELFNFKSFNFENLYNYGSLELINYIKDKLRQSHKYKF